MLSATAALRLDRGLVDQHDGDVVFDRIDAVTLGTLQAFGVLAILERLLAGRTNQNFQQIFGDHDLCIVRQRRDKASNQQSEFNDAASALRGRRQLR